MTDEPTLVNLLRNVPVREIEAALFRDGFTLRRQTQTGGRIYTHADGRITGLHFHHGSDRLKRGTLKSVLSAVGWNEEDLRRLKLL
jgi:predicted RNA binding protein YcfA (HicA-like mRNA interferase family)